MGRRFEALQRHDRIKYKPRTQFIGAGVFLVGAMALLLIDGGPYTMLVRAFTVVLLFSSIMALVRGITAVMDAKPDVARDQTDVFD